MSPYVDHEHMFAAIDHAHRQGFVLPTLVLIYTLMDSLSWLLHSNDDQSSRKRFIKWVDEFFLPKFECKCTALDLYAARCSVLHGLAWESQLTKAGQAKVLVYYVSDDGKAIEDASRQVFSQDHVTMVNLGGLIVALKASYQEFLVFIASNKERKEKVDRLLGKRYTKLTPEQFTRVASALEKLKSSNLPQQPTASRPRRRG